MVDGTPQQIYGALIVPRAMMTNWATPARKGVTGARSRNLLLNETMGNADDSVHAVLVGNEVYIGKRDVPDQSGRI